MNRRFETSWERHKSWSLVLPPSRPSLEDLYVIRAICGSIDRATPVAVMGSTPEFRTLLADLGFSRIDVVDTNAQFYEAMSSLVTSNSRTVESFVCRRWQDYFTQMDEVYGLIVSDLTLGNVPYSDREPLYRGITSSLRTGGYFVDKVLTNEGECWSIDKVRSKFSFSPLNLSTVNEFNCQAIFCGELSEKHMLESDLAYARLRAEFGRSSHLMAIVEACKSVTPPGMAWYYGKSWEAVSRTYGGQLKQVAKIAQPTSSAYYEHAFQFVHVKE